MSPRCIANLNHVNLSSARRVSSSSFHTASDGGSTFLQQSEEVQSQSFSTALAYKAFQPSLQKVVDM